MNSHLEGLMSLSLEDQYQGPLLETVLAASFAIAPNRLPPDGAQYIDQTPHIVAVNHDAVAWYCWTPDNPEGYVPAGGYFVPSWDFGDIDPGQSASRQMDFVIDDPAGLDPNDPRYDVILGTGDILMNQSTSLKISDWISPLAADMGVPYPYPPNPPNLSSDVSVFHNVPEPATLALLTLGGLALLSRRRKWSTRPVAAIAIRELECPTPGTVFSLHARRTPARFASAWAVAKKALPRASR